MKIAFAGFFAIRLAELVRAHLSIPCEVIEGDEAAILPRLADADVLVSMGFTRPMAEAAPQPAPGAGAGRRPRPHRPRRDAAGPAARQRLRPRSRHRRIHHGRDAGADALVRQPRCQPAQGSMGQPVGGRHADAAAVARACRQDAGHPGLRPYRRGARPPRRGLRHAGLRRPPAGAGGRAGRRVVHRRPRSPRRGAAPGRLSRRHAFALARDAQPAGRSPPRPDEALGLPDQRRAGRDHRRGRALPRAGRRQARRRRPRCLVSLSDDAEPTLPADAALP